MVRTIERELQLLSTKRLPNSPSFTSFLPRTDYSDTDPIEGLSGCDRRVAEDESGGGEGRIETESAILEVSPRASQEGEIRTARGDQ